MENSNNLDFIFNGDVSLANALRRIMIGDIPVIAIDTVKIKENDSSLCDEMIAHRLGLIPIRVKPGIEKKEFVIKLKAEGPRRIYARDLILPEELELPHPGIIILNLGSKEHINLVCNTEEGVGSEHAKWSASCGTAYDKIDENKYKFNIETTGSLTAKEILQKSIDVLRKDIIHYKKMI